MDVHGIRSGESPDLTKWVAAVALKANLNQAASKLRIVAQVISEGERIPPDQVQWGHVGQITQMVRFLDRIIEECRITALRRQRSS